MSDEQRAEQLKNYLLKNLVRNSDFGDKAIGLIFLQCEQRGLSKLLKHLKTVGGLVEALTNLKKAKRNPPNDLRLKEGKKAALDSSPPTEEELMRAFQMLGQLTQEEREQLGLSRDDYDVLAEQALLNQVIYKGRQSHEQIVELYKASIGTDFSENPSPSFTNLQSVKEYIEELFAEEMSPSYLSSLLANHRDQADELQEKTKNAITRLLLQAGTGQIRFIKVNDQDSYVGQYMTRSFVERFTQVTVENNLLNEEFPIYLKSITLTHPGPLPLPRQEDDQRGWLFHRQLLELCYSSTADWAHLNAPIDEDFEQLLGQHAVRVTGEFSVRLKADEASAYKGVKTHRDQQSRVHFDIKSTGLGGILSQVTRVINAALFWDIQCLKDDYFPIAHDILIHQHIFQNKIPAPALSHSLVKLCRTQTLDRALQESLTTPTRPRASSEQGLMPYEKFAFIDPSGRGNYCDFDILASATKASLQARLQAIKATGISPEEYKEDLLHRVHQRYILQKAEALVQRYPFSAFAMESLLKTELPKTARPKDKSGLPSYTIIKAYLSLTEVFLTEGAYRKAHEYLAKLQPLKELSAQWVKWCQDPDNRPPSSIDESNKAFSGALLVRYELCIADYFYSLDWQQDQDQRYLLGFIENCPKNDRTRLIQEAWRALDRAEQLLTVRLAKYHVINEASQGTFHPYYHYLNRIYFLRARLLLFFPTVAGLSQGVKYSPPTDYRVQDHKRSNTHIHGGRLFLLERSRLYAACDGDSEAYVICTAYQCWALLLAAFQGGSFSIRAASNTDNPIEMTQEGCLAWARRLRDHALLNYAEIGLHCYHEIKEKSGLSQELEAESCQFGDYYQIDPLPVIQETTRKPGYKAAILGPDVEGVQGILSLDMSYLALRRGQVDPDNPDSTQAIYLFGPKACYLFFIRGLYHLCSHDQEEFKQGTISDDRSAWDHKLEKCYNLFNYAWAIADDGCSLEHVPTADGDDKWEIKRYGNKNCDHVSASYMEQFPHAGSVWDLYPHRITEIAGLGKLFAAACTTLRLYTSNDQEQRNGEIDWLLDRLEKNLSFEEDTALTTALLGQEHYNTYLKPYLKRCMNTIEEIKQSRPRRSNLLEAKDDLMRQLFDLNALPRE